MVLRFLRREIIDRDASFLYNESNENIPKAALGFFLMKGKYMLDSFDKGWFVLQTYSGYENKVKENLLQRAQTYNMLDNMICRLTW